MTAGLCVVCGQPAVDQHHLTGWRLDPALVLPHCHDHHELAHDDWNTAGVPAKNRGWDDADQDEPPTMLHTLHLRLQRLSMWLGRLAERGLWQPVSGLLADALARWAAVLQRCINGLDSSVPSWRRASGVAT